MQDEQVAAPGTSCPGEAAIASYAWGGTAVASELSEHLAICPLCRALVVKALKTDPGPRRTDPALTLAPGTMIGRYRIEAVLGAGGMGVVYRAIDTELDRAVALKLVLPHASRMLDELAERLRRECRLQARAAHASVITVYDIGRDGDRVYVAMELVDGGTLREWLVARPRDWREVIDVLRRAGEGLAAAHAAGLVHRDFKPDNVLVELDGDRIARVLVIDFGVARALEESEQASSGLPAEVGLTVTGAVVGTPGYMAPEQLGGQPVDARSDVFTFGVTLWEALYGTRPFTGVTIGELVVAMDAPLPPPPRRPGRDRVPRWVDLALRRALAIDPATRYQAMEPLLHDLDWRRNQRRRRSTRIGLAAVVATGAAVFATGLALRGGAAASPCDDDPGASRALTTAAERFAAAPVPGTLAARHAYWRDAVNATAAEVPRLRAAACAATTPAANRTEQVRCLDQRAAQLAGFVGVVASGEPAALADLIVYSQPPTTPHECLGDAAARLVALYPGDAATTTALAEARILTARIPAVLATEPDPARRSQRVAELIEHATARVGTRAPAFAHELAFDAARIAISTGASTDVIRDVALAADRDGQIEIAGRAWLALLRSSLGVDEAGRTSDLLAQADAAITRAGDPPRDRAQWHATRAMITASSNDAKGAAEAIRSAEAVLASHAIPFDTTIAMMLGAVHLRLGEMDRALALQKQAFEFMTMVPTSTGEDLAIRNSYATGLMAAGQADQTVNVLEATVAARDPATPIKGDLTTSVTLLVQAYNILGRHPDAMRVAEAWQAAIDASRGPRSYSAATSRMAYAAAAMGVKRFADAVRASGEALEIDTELLGAEDYDTADVRMLHAQALLAIGKRAEARAAAERGAKDLAAASTPDDPVVAQARVILAEVMLAQGDTAAAIGELEPALAIYQTLDDPRELTYPQVTLARALIASHKDLPRARELIEAALATWQAEPDAWHDEIADARTLLARAR